MYQNFLKIYNLIYILMKRNIKYPNIVYCEEDPRLCDDYVQPLDCMDLRKV